jgi:hypothetical protein
VKIIGIKGSMITIETKEGQQLARDASLFKRSGSSVEKETSTEEEKQEENKERKIKRIRKPIVRFDEHKKETWCNRIESEWEMK